MDLQLAANLLHGALVTALCVILPAMVALFLITLLCGVLQALTQVQDPILTAAPRLVVGLLALLALLPWMMDRLVAYTAELYEGVAASLY